MPENSQLLNQVLEKPDEDGPRLAYAAWCEHQSDDATKARAEFIRTQIALAHVQLGTDPQPDYPLRYRSEKLTAIYRGEWGRPLAALADDYAFDRGFIEQVTLSARHFLDRAPQLFSLAPIRHLKLTLVRLDAAELYASPHLRRIRSLELSRSELGDADVAMLADSPNLPELRFLSLTENHISPTGADALARTHGLPRLAYVNFYGNVADLNEQYAYDSGLVVDSFMPEAGRKLEERSRRPLRWLHHEAKTVADAVPNRFRIRAPQGA
jgi:uncharacterized protein (TIGR02996 family)